MVPSLIRKIFLSIKINYAMPTNKNAMTRYKILDELLSNQYHDYSLNDLTEEVNRRLEECGQSVSRRMIEKDIHYL